MTFNHLSLNRLTEDFDQTKNIYRYDFHPTLFFKFFYCFSLHKIFFYCFSLHKIDKLVRKWNNLIWTVKYNTQNTPIHQQTPVHYLMPNPLYNIPNITPSHTLSFSFTHHINCANTLSNSFFLYLSHCRR